jgi:hypothetical protein
MIPIITGTSLQLVSVKDYTTTGASLQLVPIKTIIQFTHALIPTPRRPQIPPSSR